MYTLPVKFTLKDTHYEKVIALATKDFEHWEKKRGGRRQCTNTMKGCISGVASEFASIMYIKQQLNEQGYEFEIKPWGLMERRDGKRYNQPDIVVDIKDKGFIGVEVKSVNKGYPKGQITPYHTDKYIKDKIFKVFFVEVFHNTVEKTIEATVYISASPKNIKDWKTKTNCYGNVCYTHEDYI